ncbi:MAG: PAS domain S-box protein [Verrucomicrobiae bacterium]|nr:PAS domain S-box protein [Verrucomicrobiae bacterium]
MDDTARRFFDQYEHARELILVVDRSGSLVFANAAWRATLGYPFHDLAGLSLFDVTHRADHAVCQAWLSHPEGDSSRKDIRIAFLAHDGHRVLVEEIPSASRELGEAGKESLLQGVFRDLSRECRTEAALREGAELFSLFTNHTPLGVFRTDPDGRLIYTSARWRQIAGLSHVGQPRGVWWQIVHPLDRDPVLTQWHSALRHQLEFNAEFRIHGDASAERWCRMRMSQSIGPDGTERGGIGTLEDITESRDAALALKRAHSDLEERVRARTSELEAANRELAEFAYVVSHDLKAPLRGVSLLSEWLAQDYAERLGPEGVTLFHKLRHRVQEMHGLVDGVLAYMRIGKVTEESEEIVPVGPLVLEIIQALGCPEGIQFNVPGDLPVVRALPAQLRQVFQNLLDNAVKFLGRPTGTVTVEAGRMADGWEFGIRDTGRGISPRHHARIFQIFKRLHPDPTVPGTGIGLALVKRIVEGRGGRITVESEEGAGARFRFTWPDLPEIPNRKPA